MYAAVSYVRSSSSAIEVTFGFVKVNLGKLLPVDLSVRVKLADVGKLAVGAPAMHLPSFRLQDTHRQAWHLTI